MPSHSGACPETMDFPDWLVSLSRRDCRIAESLALGNRTGEVVQRFRWPQSALRLSTFSSTDLRGGGGGGSAPVASRIAKNVPQSN